MSLSNSSISFVVKSSPSLAALAAAADDPVSDVANIGVKLTKGNPPPP